MIYYNDITTLQYYGLWMALMVQKLNKYLVVFALYSQQIDCFFNEILYLKKKINLCRDSQDPLTLTKNFSIIFALKISRILLFSRTIFDSEFLKNFKFLVCANFYEGILPVLCGQLYVYTFRNLLALKEDFRSACFCILILYLGKGLEVKTQIMESSSTKENHYYAYNKNN